MCKVSVIVPIYNVEPFLRQALDSVVNQSFRDFEMILVDDGSTDKSGEIADEYGEKYSYAKVIHKKNGGVSSARNAGLDAAKGEYIYFLDADDYLELDALEVLLCVSMEENVDMVVCNFRLVRDGETIFFTDRGKRGKEWPERTKHKAGLEHITAYLSSFYGFEPVNKIFKRKVIEENRIRFSEDVTLGEDYLFNACYWLHINSLCIDKRFLYNYQLRTDSATQAKRKFDYINHYNGLYNKFLAYANRAGKSVQLKKLLPSVYFSFILHALEEQFRHNSDEDFTQSCVPAVRRMLAKFQVAALVRAALLTVQRVWKKMVRSYDLHCDNGELFQLKRGIILFFFGKYKLDTGEVMCVR